MADSSLSSSTNTSGEDGNNKKKAGLAMAAASKAKLSIEMSSSESTNQQKQGSFGNINGGGKVASTYSICLAIGNFTWVKYFPSVKQKFWVQYCHHFMQHRGIFVPNKISNHEQNWMCRRLSRKDNKLLIAVKVRDPF